ncbi:S-adenosyl-L-methionine-dependent methyltransferase [Phellopilus nigrolimitatus]|nr:S-adenosyl-L-methionine-dependent methyltransferase [Phellopilus nigrolimitatus]
MLTATATELHTPEGLRNLFGRGMNLGSELYKLPADKQEMDRLSLQHRIWKLMVGGLYPKEAEDAVQRALRRGDGDSRQPMILDIGSGSGSWTVEMAMKFPHAKVIGMDLIQSNPGYIPPNCSFVKANATIALEKYACQFDVIQCRSVAKHVPDASALTRSIAKSLRPGGVFFFADAVTLIYDANKEPNPPVQSSETTFEDGIERSWFARWLLEVTGNWTTKALQKTEGDKLNILIREDSQLEYLGEKAYWSPINWDGADPIENPNGAEVGKLMVLNVFDFLQASKPSLLSGGLSEKLVNTWVENVQKETLDPAKRLLMKWVVTWAEKTE